LECGGKRSATPLWIRRYRNAKKSKAPPLSAHCKFRPLSFREDFFSSLLEGWSPALSGLKRPEMLRD